MIAQLAQTPRVTDAAERLALTPSALSHRIREAERRLDVPLFTRINKRLVMTPAAEHLAETARRILADLARAEGDVQRMHRGVRFVVRLAIEAYTAYHWLPAFLRYLRQHEPSVGIHVVAAAARHPLDSLFERSVDLVIVSGENAHSRAERFHLFDDELLFIMPPDHPLVGRAYITGDDMVGQDFITYTRIPEPDREYAKLFRPNGTYPNWTETIELPEAIVEMVAAGLGTSVLAQWATKHAVQSGRICTARVSSEGLCVPWYAAIRQERQEEEHILQTVAQHLATWCHLKNGLPLGCS